MSTIMDSCFSRIPPTEFAPFTMEVLITIFFNRVKKSSCPYGQEADESTNHLQRQRSSPPRENAAHFPRRGDYIHKDRTLFKPHSRLF